MNKNAWLYGKFEKEFLDKVMCGEKVFVDLEKGEVMKAKELLNQTDVDFRYFSELWEKAHANR